MQTVDITLVAGPADTRSPSLRATGHHRKGNRHRGSVELRLVLHDGNRQIRSKFLKGWNSAIRHQRAHKQKISAIDHKSKQRRQSHFVTGGGEGIANGRSLVLKVLLLVWSTTIQFTAHGRQNNEWVHIGHRSTHRQLHSLRRGLHQRYGQLNNDTPGKRRLIKVFKLCLLGRC